MNRMTSTKILKAHCKKRGQYFFIEVEKDGFAFFANSINQITLEEASKVKSEISPLALQTSSKLPKCKTCGSRRVGHGHGNDHVCTCDQTACDAQCIYCDNLVYDKIGEVDVIQVKPKIESYDVFFVMDASGSMMHDLVAAANAARTFIDGLKDQNNTYFYVPFGSTYKYLVKAESDITKIYSFLRIYEQDKSNVGAGTNGDVIEFIKNEVVISKKPVRIIILTDGVWDSENKAIIARNEILRLKKDVEFLAIGIGSANSTFLKKLGTVDKFSKVIEVSNLESTFRDMSKYLSVK